MPAQTLTPTMVSQEIQHYAMEQDRADASRTRNNKEKMDVDRVHTEKTGNKHHRTSTYVEPPREEEKRKAEKHLAERHRKRKKEDGIHLERNGENGHKQTRAEDHGRWLMFPSNKQAKVSK